MEVTLNVNLEKFRYSLVGDGYILEEVKTLTTGQLIDILNRRVQDHINKEFSKSHRIGLFDKGDASVLE